MRLQLAIWGSGTAIRLCTFIFGGLLALSANELSAQDSRSATASSSVKMPLLQRPEDADRTILLDMNRVEIRVFIKMVGELTGVNFLVDDAVQGTVSIISPTPVRVGDVYDILESVLQTRGYAAVPAGRLVKIVPWAKATRSNLPLQVGNDPALIEDSDRLVTQIFRVRFIEVAKLNPVVASLVSSGGQVTAFAENNTLIVTDASANVKRVAEVLVQLDEEASEKAVELVKLQYASAQTTASQIKQILTGSNGRVSGASRRSGQGKEAMEEIEILPDDRTNSLILTADPNEMGTILELVKKLDVESPVEAGYVHVIYLIHAEAAEVEKSVSAAMGRLTASAIDGQKPAFQATADESTNSLVVVASPQDYVIVKNMVEKLDIVREQILVEFQIVEASKDVLDEMGVDWATLDGAVADSVRGFGGTNLGIRSDAESGDLGGLALGLFKDVGGDTEIGAILAALETSSDINVLSTPSVLTSNHQEASIVVVDNVPYVSQSRVTDADVSNTTAIRSYDFKDVGIELTVRPHVSSGGQVRLEVDTSYSKLIEGTTVSDSEIPTTAQRKASTVISIMSGTTVVIGGMMRDDKETVIKKVPLLGDLPLLGGLFRSQSEQIQKNNLLLFITPHVLSDRDDLIRITEQKRQEQLEHNL